jgi:hypothetical protein
VQRFNKQPATIPGLILKRVYHPIRNMDRAHRDNFEEPQSLTERRLQTIQRRRSPLVAIGIAYFALSHVAEYQHDPILWGRGLLVAIGVIVAIGSSCIGKLFTQLIFLRLLFLAGFTSKAGYVRLKKSVERAFIHKA